MDKLLYGTPAVANPNKIYILIDADYIKKIKKDDKKMDQSNIY